MSDAEDICGLCGQPGADKVAHPVHWPGEKIPNSSLVHAECETEECRRAHAALTDRELWRLYGTRAYQTYGRLKTTNVELIERDYD